MSLKSRPERSGFATTSNCGRQIAENELKRVYQTQK